MNKNNKLGFWYVFCVASGAMISSGLFILPGLAYTKAGPSVFLAYFLAALFAVAGMLSMAELMTSKPNSNYDNFFAARGLGSAIGTFSGILSWFSLTLKSAFAIFGLAIFASLYLLNFNQKIIAIILCLVFAAISIIGLRKIGKLQIFGVFIVFTSILFFLITGFAKINLRNFQPFSFYGFEGIIKTTGFIFVSYGGLLFISSVSKDIAKPAKVIPYALTSALICVGVFYTLVVFVVTGLLGGADLSETFIPVSEAAYLVLGNTGFVTMMIVAVIALSLTATGGVSASVKYPFALSQEGFIPLLFSKKSPLLDTPYASLITTIIIMIVFLSFNNIEILINAASTVIILIHILSCSAVIILRESKMQEYLPEFRAPLYPYIQVLGIVSLVYLLFAMDMSAILFTFILILSGFSLYWFYGRIKADREYALLYLIDRIKSKELKSDFIEDELKEIIKESENIAVDKFNKVIKHSYVLDIKDKIDSDSFFLIASQELSKKLNLPKEIIHKKLLEKESEYSSVINHHLAIPHIIIEGEKTFFILLVRCSEGIDFKEVNASINTVFVIAGSQDQRSFHLRALASIAKAAHDPNFEKRWLNANSEEALKNTIILANKRKKQEN